MSILEPFEPLSVFRGITPLFPPDIMLEIIEACRQADLRIYGFDGFKLYENGGVQPFMEHSADYSNVEDKQEIFQRSKAFIRERADLGLMFEIVVEGDHEPGILARRAAKVYPQVVSELEEARKTGDLRKAERLEHTKCWYARLIEEGSGKTEDDPAP